MAAFDETLTYGFGLAPTAFTVLPPEVQTMVGKWRKTMNESALIPAKAVLKDRQTVVVKTKITQLEQTVAGEAVRTQKWSVPDIQVFLQRAAAPVVAIQGAGGFHPDYSKTDFDGFDWISARNFTGIQKVQGQDCPPNRDVSDAAEHTNVARPTEKEGASGNGAARAAVNV